MQIDKGTNNTSGDFFNPNFEIRHKSFVKDAQLNFQHIHEGAFTARENNNGKTRHACLKNGLWCWSNFWEFPLDIFKFIKATL